MNVLRSLFVATAFAGVVTSLGCSEQEVVTQLHSLSASEDAVFLCRDDNGAGHPYSDCPDLNTADDHHKDEHLSVFALVSQTVTDEVAVVNVSAGKVVDVDPGTPGYAFLRVGGRPVSMVATPGGTATFVATADVGRNGLFGLTTKCLSSPQEGEPPRDLTSWPACRLPEAPGEIAVVVEPFTDSTDTSGCSSNKYDTTATPPNLQNNGLGDKYDPDKPDCRDDLLNEAGPAGRRKLVVSFPDSGRLGIYDAQKVLRTRPGAFPECEPDGPFISLKAEIPTDVTQVLPPDLQTDCSEVPPPSAAVSSAEAPRPAGFAQSEDRLYIADRAAPVIHVLDTTTACGMHELPSLLPMSLREPERVVTTRRLAVSPLTPSGQRFVYAIDTDDQPYASVMAFDVSPTSTNPTPLVLPGSPELPPVQKPDRLAFDGPARDVTFAYRDIPYVDPDTGVATFGNRCDPTRSDPKDPAVLAHPSADLTLGARPGLLRGLFGFILQTNGNIAVVDVDDFDAACRRPENAGQPFRGCEADTVMDTVKDGLVTPAFSGTDGNQRPFVTNEISCRVVEPHRFRSGRPISTTTQNAAAHAPSLRGFPQLTLPPSAPSTDVTDRPRMLAVPYDVKGMPVAAQVMVGSALYATDGQDALTLPSNPDDSESSALAATQNTLILPPLEPRSYSSDDSVSLTYEGALGPPQPAGFIGYGDQGQLVLKDASLAFCATGVYDVPTMRSYAESELGVSAGDSQAFAVLHADFVQITADFPASDDSYWSHSGGPSWDDCKLRFGAVDADPLPTERDLRIERAFSGELWLTPASDTASDAMEMVTHCFPGAVSYKIRAGSQWVLWHSGVFRHDVVESGSDRACVRSCNPLKKWGKARVFEISSSLDHCKAAKSENPLEQRVGCAHEGETACVFDQQVAIDALKTPGAQFSPPGLAARCVFNGLNDRFAVYRGRAKSERDSVFSWATTGGFAPQFLPMRTLSSAVSPQSIQYLGQPEQLAVVDGATLGLTLFSLDSLSVVKPSPFY